MRVLITGASSGIGAATARAFAAQGARIVLIARSEDPLQALADEIGDQAVAHPCDASDPEAVARMAQQVRDHLGVPDVVINCAGAGRWERLEDTTPQEARDMMNAPYFAAYNVTHAFIRDFLERDAGTFIHVNSPACFVPWRSSVGYAAARGALRFFHEALAQDLAGTGVHSCHAVFGKVSSDYFDNNPGVEGKMPTANMTVPTLSPQDCAKTLVQLAHRPRYQTIRPLIMRFYTFLGRLFPGIMRVIVRM